LHRAYQATNRLRQLRAVGEKVLTLHEFPAAAAHMSPILDPVSALNGA
jgi:hypothetical protein